MCVPGIFRERGLEKSERQHFTHKIKAKRSKIYIWMLGYSISNRFYSFDLFSVVISWNTSSFSCWKARDANFSHLSPQNGGRLPGNRPSSASRLPSCDLENGLDKAGKLRRYEGSTGV